MESAVPEIVYLNSEEDSLPFFAALASKTRLEMLRLLREKEMSIKEMSASLHISSAIVTRHIQVLEEAGLVTTRTLSGKRGLRKLCSLKINEAQIIFDNNYEQRNRRFTQVEIPICSYDRADITPPCGLADDRQIFGRIDDPRYFLASNRHGLSLLWFTSGYVEYPIPIFDVDTSQVSEMEISMEICSECPGFNAGWQSDIVFSINGLLAGTWTSPGDFGDRKGKYTPSWWTLGTEYGLKKTLRITPEGTYMDHERLSDLTLQQVLEQSAGKPEMRLRIESPKEAEHPGGLNLFGRSFGDYDQNILVRFLHEGPSKEEMPALGEQSSRERQTRPV